ncbi:DAD family protein [Peziza echinospora]|nr:DAD family protein [Peziza echinospora]
MPAKKTATAAATHSVSQNRSAAPTTEATAVAAAPAAKKPVQSTSNPITISANVWDNYVTSTSQRTKLIDVFLGFLVVTGVLQFLYCVLVGNYPFNAFLAGFSASVGQFVLTASLRIQSQTANSSEFPEVSQERAFADFVFGSLLLHLFCTNFIN